MTIKQKKQIILEFIKTCEFGVVATIALGSQTPESAVVAVSETENLEIVFASHADARKNKNIAQNSHISAVIGWDTILKTTVQFEGIAVLLEGTEREECETYHCVKNKGSRKYWNDPEEQYFKVIPRWIRYSNHSVDPKEIWELEF